MIIEFLSFHTLGGFIVFFILNISYIILSIIGGFLAGALIGYLIMGIIEIIKFISKFFD